MTPPDQVPTWTLLRKQASIADLAWWELFKDPVLQGLIQEALKNNYDVRIAAARVEEERALVGVIALVVLSADRLWRDISGQRAPDRPPTTPTTATTSISRGNWICGAASVA